MDNFSFHPRRATTVDHLSTLLTRAARTVLVIALGLLPIFFVPLSAAPANYTKSLLVLMGVAIALVLYALSLLRRGSVAISMPFVLVSVWILAAVYAASAFYSGDLPDAFLGDTFGVYTTGFWILMAGLMTVIYLVGFSKAALGWFYGIFAGSSLLLALYHLSRAVFGADFLTFGLFDTAYASPYGSWNDLAIFFGLVLIISLPLIRRLPLTLVSLFGLSIISILSLAMLALVNFFLVWVLVAAASLFMLVQALLSADQRTGETNQTIFVAYALIVFTISLLFAVFNSSLGGIINLYTESSYLEMRPSFAATFEISKQIFQNDPIFGIGPNKFVDAWRLYKDPQINETVFWDTNFVGGSGFVPTGMVTAGLLGALAWMIFLTALLWRGGRWLFSPVGEDPLWHTVGVASFLASAYLWVVAVVYTPSVPTLLLTAAATGLFFSAYGILRPARQISLPFLGKRMSGVVLICVMVAILGGTVASLRVVLPHYAAGYAFSKAIEIDPTTGRQEKRERVASIHDQFPSDIFSRWLTYQLFFSLNGIMSNDESEVDDSIRARFQDFAARAVQAGRVAVNTDPTEPMNWVALGQIYSLLTLAGIDGAYKMGTEAYDTARQYDPQNPSILLLKAQLEARHGDFNTARSLAGEALEMKPNYTDAYFFSAQLDIVEEKIPEAIMKINSIVALEPSNPKWHYQLGTLYMSNSEYTPAMSAFERALALDPQFANARYFLALVLAQSGNFQAALSHLREVERTNPDHQLIKDAMTAFTRGQAVTLPNNSLETAPIESDEVSPDGLGGSSPVVTNGGGEVFSDEAQ